MSISPTRLKCRIYIDGYNFYYGLMRDRADWKWLNLEKFFVSQLNRFYIVDKIKYFTAIVDEDHAYSPTKERQLKFLEALATTPRIEIIYGKYQSKVLRCGAECGQEYSAPREKKTDVNIAIHMMDDCTMGLTEAVILVSGDSDLEPAVGLIHKRFPEIAINVLIPTLPKDMDIRRADFYKGIGIPCGPLPTGRIAASQFDGTIKIRGDDGRLQRVIQRPPEWKIPEP
jgi:6-hydroxy-3-succinoylpyridine 3-monooxygenase